MIKILSKLCFKKVAGYCARVWSLYTVGLQMVDLGKGRQTGVVRLLPTMFLTLNGVYNPRHPPSTHNTSQRTPMTNEMKKPNLTC